MNQQIIMLLALVAVFYFFMIRPQIKKQKTEHKFREALSKGDKVVTIGGLHGKVFQVNDSNLILELEGGQKVKIEKKAVLPRESSTPEKK